MKKERKIKEKKKKNEERDEIEEKRKRESYLATRGEKVFTKINPCTHVLWRIFGL